VADQLAASGAVPGERAGDPVPPLAAGASLVTLSQVVTAVAGAAMSVAVARILGAAGTGAFNLIQSATLIAIAFSSLGIEVGISYLVAAGRWAAWQALRQAVLAAAVLGIVGGGVAYAVIIAVADSAFEGVVSTTALVVGLAAVPFGIAVGYGSYLGLAQHRYRLYLLGPAGQALAALVLVSLLAAVWGLTAAIAGLTLAWAVSAIVLLAMGVRLWPARGPWLVKAPRHLWVTARFGIQANLTNALQLVNYRAGLFFLGASAGPAAVGQFAVALSVTSIGLFVPRALSAVLVPRVASAGDAERDRQRALIIKSVRHAAVVVAGIALPLSIGLLAVPLAYGDEFRPSVELGLILVPGVSALGLAGVFAASILGRGLPRYGLYTALISTPVTLVLYVTLIPWLDAEGAAIASTLSYVLTTVLMYGFFVRVTGIRGLRLLVPGRDELDDYRRLLGDVRRRLRRGSER
jgi:O-antigen/teichoic acid export membrane protein